MLSPLIGLILTNVASIYWGPNPLSKETDLNWLKLLMSGVTLVLIAPFIEECIFRSGMPILLGSLEWEPYLSNLLFAMCHVGNYHYFSSASLIARQVFLAFWMGMYLSDLPTLGQAICCHILYNIVSYSVTVVLAYRYHPEIFQRERLDPWIGYCSVKLGKRCKSYSDFLNLKAMLTYKDEVKYINFHRFLKGISRIRL